MLYLAKKENNTWFRIQVCRSHNGWNVLDHTGTLKLIVDMKCSYEDLLNQLVKNYGNSPLILSKRIVDYKDKHIVCLEKKYYVFNTIGRQLLSSYNRLEFSEEGAIIAKLPTYAPAGPIPDYYADAELAIKEEQIWCGYDIDTGLWVCFNGNSPDFPVISSDPEKDVAIQIAIDSL